ncbi:hypothetical protein KRE42_08525 [Elizabethkingia meningoseptica]|uniref:hypothetical protein n=1 Tax=Elizabethkingia meningoseptica TaxID=238 RepID=UPI0023AF5E93|nr:hypothetical protein [Elizabethkingia meningoseptica]MDE5537116.1 hypothetical protein [Elizabethkingia meningoseptica]
MSNYNNNYRPAGNWNNYQQRGSGAPYSRNYSRNGYGNSQNRTQYKKSGATYTRIKKGKGEGLMAVNAWRKTKFGVMTANAMPYHAGDVSTSQRGNDYIKYIVTVTNMSFGIQQVYTCLMNVKSQVIVISELGLCITPNGSGRTASGKNVRGYFGKFTRR